MTDYTGPNRRSKDPWHNNLWTTISIIFGMLSTVGTVIFQGGQITSELKQMQTTVSTIVTTNETTQRRFEDLTARVIKNEVLISENGKVLADFKATIEKLNATLSAISNEQQRRGSVIENLQKQVERQK